MSTATATVMVGGRKHCSWWHSREAHAHSEGFKSESVSNAVRVERDNERDNERGTEGQRDRAR